MKSLHTILCRDCTIYVFEYYLICFPTLSFSHFSIIVYFSFFFFSVFCRCKLDLAIMGMQTSSSIIDDKPLIYVLESSEQSLASCNLLGQLLALSATYLPACCRPHAAGVRTLYNLISPYLHNQTRKKLKRVRRHPSASMLYDRHHFCKGSDRVLKLSFMSSAWTSVFNRYANNEKGQNVLQGMKPLFIVKLAHLVDATSQAPMWHPYSLINPISIVAVKIAENSLIC